MVSSEQDVLIMGSFEQAMWVIGSSEQAVIGDR